MMAFFSYYGSKFRGYKHYPHPHHDVIIEPFAGAAAYACQLSGCRRVVLVEKNPVIAGIWKYLKKVTWQEILSLPDLEEDQQVSDLKVCQEAKWLIGYWVNKGCSKPAQTASKWMRDERYSSQFWGPRKRKVIANQIPFIRNWKIIEGDYTLAPDIKATWFVDPPYIDKGYAYACNGDDIDYAHLGEWCRTRKGQVIVCEQEGAEWLPFEKLKTLKANHATGVTKEVIWVKDNRCPPRTLF